MFCQATQSPMSRQGHRHANHGVTGYILDILDTFQSPWFPKSQIGLQWVEVEPMPPKSKPKEPSPAATLPSPNNLTFWILLFSFVLLQSPVRWRLDKICVVCLRGLFVLFCLVWFGLVLFGGSRWKLGGLLQLWASTGQRRCASLHWIHDHDKCIQRLQSAIAKEG